MYGTSYKQYQFLYKASATDSVVLFLIRMAAAILVLKRKSEAGTTGHIPVELLFPSPPTLGGGSLQGTRWALGLRRSGSDPLFPWFGSPGNY